MSDRAFWEGAARIAVVAAMAVVAWLALGTLAFAFVAAEECIPTPLGCMPPESCLPYC